MIHLLLFAGTAGPAHEPAVYPIEPVPLRALIQEAELIVIAMPDATEDAPDVKDEWLDSRTKLRIVKVLKGALTEDSLSVYTCDGLVCPADARFTSGQSSLVFLMKSKGLWRPCSLSYGAKDLSADGLLAYEARIREYLALQLLPQGKERDAAELEWIVRVAQSPHSRWDGAYELAAPETGFAARLSPEQRALLLEALIAAPVWDEGSQTLFSLFSAEHDPRLIRWMLDCLGNASAGLSWNYDVAMLWIDDQLSDPKLSAWMYSTWTYSGSGAQKSLLFRTGTKGQNKRRAEEEAAVQEYVARARKAFAAQTAR